MARFEVSSDLPSVIIEQVRPMVLQSTGLSKEQVSIRRPDVAVRRLRMDVQALRAVAVTAVVLYHLFPQRLPGGFVGVDVFFVISGYLITSHLVRELDQTGRLRLTHFWARRIRRLLPAALVVLGACVVLMLTLMPRLTWQSNLEQVAASAAYIQNWLLGINSVDYLAAHDSATVAQHYWSLSVEEQFYLVWPLLLLGMVAVRRRLRRWSNRSTLAAGLSAVTVVSLASSVYLTGIQQSLAFFATPTRAWEFAVGGLLALVPAAALGDQAGARRAGLSWAGLVLTFASLFVVTGQQPFPGWIALLPVIGAGLVLVAGEPAARWSPAALFRQTPVQWVGDHSYSIYLWHWPLIIVAPWVLHGPTPWPAKGAIAGLTLALAYVTKRFVENPVRLGRRWQARRPAYALAVCGLALLLVVSVVLVGQIRRDNEQEASQVATLLDESPPCYGAAALVAGAGCSSPFARPTHLDLAFAAADDGVSDRCQPSTGVSTLTLCPLGQTQSPTKTVVVVGNSHALRLAPALEQYGLSRGWQIILAAKTDCMGLIAEPIGNQQTTTCQVWSAKLQQYLLSTPHLAGVVFVSHNAALDYLAGINPTPAEVAEASDRVLATWSTLRAHHIGVVVTSDVPGMRPQADPECLAMSRAIDDPCAVPRASVVLPNVMTQLAQQHPELVGYVDLTRYFCDAAYCHALIGGVVVYSDAHHTTGTFARSFGRYLGPEVESLLGAQS